MRQTQQEEMEACLHPSPEVVYSDGGEVRKLWCSLCHGAWWESREWKKTSNVVLDSSYAEAK